MNARGAINPPAGLVRLANLLGQLRLAQSRRARHTPLPGIVAAPRDAKYSAHDDHGKLVCVSLNELKPYDGCLAKNAVAFFKISRSINSRLFSSRRRRSSACIDSLPLVPLPAAGPYCFSQLRRELGSTPRLLDASAIV